MTGNTNPNMKRVQGIVPLGAMPTNEEDLRQFVNEVNGISTKEGRRGFEEYSNLTKKDYTRLRKIRDKMISNVMGIDPEVLKDYYKARGVNTSGIASANDEKSVKRVKKVAKVANVAINTAFGYQLVRNGLVAATMGFPALVGSLAFAIPMLPFMALGKVAIKHVENSGGAQREYQRELLKKLEPYRTRIDALEKEISKHYDLIENNRKTMDKKEFEAWQQNFTRAMCERVEAACGPVDQRQA